MNKPVFRVGVTRDFLGPDGTSDLDDIAGPLFDQAGLHWEYGNISQKIHRYYKRRKCRIMTRS